MVKRVPEIWEYEPPREPETLLEASRTVAVPQLCGRSSQTAQIRDCLEAIVAAPNIREILLSGASGAGKTALTQWAYAEAINKGFQTAQATCEPFHAGVSFFPVKEVIRQLCKGVPVSEFVGKAFGFSSYEAQLARSLDSETLDVISQRDNTLATFANVVIGAAKQLNSPVLIEFDDLERIDSASADALSALFSRLAEAPIVFLGAFRSDVVEADPDHPLRSVLEKVTRQSNSGMVIPLGPIESESLSDLVEHFLDGPMEPNEFFLDRLESETEGNPLFVREVLHSLATARDENDQPVLRQVDGVWIVRVSPDNQWTVPKSIEDAIESRLRSLTDVEREVLNAAAVIGRRFRFETLLELCKLGEDELIDMLDRFSLLEIIQELRGTEDTYEFTHGKICDVVYNSISGLRKTKLHSRVADVLVGQERMFPEEYWENLVGTHLFRARKYDAASPYLEKAGHGAMRLQVFREAIDAFQRCLESLEKSNTPDPRKIAEVTLLLGESLKLAGHLDAAVRQLEIVVGNSSEAPEARRWAFNHLGDIYRMHDQYEQAASYYQQCEEEARSGHDDELLVEVAADVAELHMRQRERLAGPDPEAAQWHQEQYEKYLQIETELAEHSESELVQARSFRNRAKYERATGKLDLSIELYEKSIALSESSSRLHRYLIPYAKALRLVGRLDDATKIVKDVLDWSCQIGAIPSEAIARQYYGLVLMDAAYVSAENNYSAAEGELKKAYALHGEVGFTQGRRETAVNLFELSLMRGDDIGARKWLRLSNEHVTGSDDISDEFLLNAVLSQLRANGDADRADRIEKLSAGGLSGRSASMSQKD